jgi:hypothetical protein
MNMELALGEEFSFDRPERQLPATPQPGRGEGRHTMNIIVRASADDVADHVHDELVAHLSAAPATVLGLPTGGTPVPIYARLVERFQNGRCSFKHASTFNLDEYVGLGADHPASYAAYMRRHLFDHVDCPIEQRHIPNGLAADVVAEAQEYERAIAAAGGLDYVLLGLGQNAHIGFNDPIDHSGECALLRRGAATAGPRDIHGYRHHPRSAKDRCRGNGRGQGRGRPPHGQGTADDRRAGIGPATRPRCHHGAGPGRGGRAVTPRRPVIAGVPQRPRRA